MQFKDIAAFSFKLIWLRTSGLGTFIKRLGQICVVQGALRKSGRSVALNKASTACLALDDVKLALSHTVVHILAALAACSKCYEKRSACFIKNYYYYFFKPEFFLFKKTIGAMVWIQIFFHPYSLYYLVMWVKSPKIKPPFYFSPTGNVQHAAYLLPSTVHLPSG